MNSPGETSPSNSDTTLKTLAILVQGLELAKSAAAFSPIPLTPAIEICLQICKTFQGAIQTNGDLRELVEEAASLLLTIQNSKLEPKTSWNVSAFQREIGDLEQTLQEVLRLVQTHQSRRKGAQRVVDILSDQETRDIDDFRKRITRAVRKFDIAADVDAWKDRQNVRSILQRLEENIKDAATERQKEIKRSGHPKDRLLAASSTSAFYNSPRPATAKTHEGTRRQILTRLAEWAEQSDTTDASKPVTWIYGDAGAGKTSIAATFARECAKKGNLLASFFFWRRDPTCTTSEKLIPTLAYAMNVEALSKSSPFTDAAIISDPAIFDKDLTTQLEKLILRPLLESGTRADIFGHKFVVVIDGLDEVSDKDDQIRIVNAFMSIAGDGLPFRIIFTGRPEQQLMTVFGKLEFQSHLTTIALSADYNADEDIRQFLKDSFRDLKSTYSFVPPDWPAEADIETLVAKASGQFIYGSVVVKYVGSGNDPAYRLGVVLGLKPKLDNKSPFAELDQLFSHILASVESPDDTITLLYLLSHDSFPASFPALDQLLNWPAGKTQSRLQGLESIIKISPESEENRTGKVEVSHKSLFDYLLDPVRNTQFHSIYGIASALFALRALRLLKQFPPLGPTAFYLDSLRKVEREEILEPQLEISADTLISLIPQWLETAQPSLELDQEVSSIPQFGTFAEWCIMDDMFDFGPSTDKYWSKFKLMWTLTHAVLRYTNSRSLACYDEFAEQFKKAMKPVLDSHNGHILVSIHFMLSDPWLREHQIDGSKTAYIWDEYDASGSTEVHWLEGAHGQLHLLLWRFNLLSEHLLSVLDSQFSSSVNKRKYAQAVLYFIGVYRRNLDIINTPLLKARRAEMRRHRTQFFYLVLLYMLPGLLRRAAATKEVLDSLKNQGITDYLRGVVPAAVLEFVWENENADIKSVQKIISSAIQVFEEYEKRYDERKPSSRATRKFKQLGKFYKRVKAHSPLKLRSRKLRDDNSQ